MEYAVLEEVLAVAEVAEERARMTVLRVPADGQAGGVGELVGLPVAGRLEDDAG